MKSSTSSPYLLAPLLFTLVGCSRSPVEAMNRPFDIVLRATSDEGQPVEGARFANGDSTIGTTDATGTVAATIHGTDGQTLPVTTLCPAGYIAPEQPTPLRLTAVHRVNQTAPATIASEVVCTRKLRDVMLMVRTSHAPVLPVDMGGRNVGQVDASGYGHFRLQLDRDVRSISVNLGTAAAPKLRPQNPSRVFELEGQDAILLFDQTFTVERDAPLRRRTVPANPLAKHAPYRIDSGRNHAF
jgi:hypothetical protein